MLLRIEQIWIFTDDIYEKLIYDDFDLATMVQAEPRLRDRTITMNGCSKILCDDRLAHRLRRRARAL